MELDRGLDQRMYINIYSVKIAPDCEYPEYAKLSVVIDGQKYEMYARLLEGNQRILLSDDDAEKIICALMNGFDVEISVGRYCSVIPANGFSETYSRLKRIRTWG